MAITVGSIVDGKVTGITKFGAFVEIENAKVGLVHISEVADAYVKDVNDYLKVGDNIKVKVLSIEENGKIGLSIKQAILPKPKEKQPPMVVFDSESPRSGAFEDKLARFMKDSDEKLVALKKHQEGKKGR